MIPTERFFRRPWLPALLGAVLAITTPLLAAEPHRFGVQDMIDMQRVSGPTPSPDGSLLAFELRSYSLESNRGSADLWLVAAEGGEPRRLTTSDGQDFGASWSPDGRRLAFLSTRSGSSQVWILPIDGGEAMQATDLPVDVEAVKWSPDGKRLALAMAVYPDCGDLQCTVDRDREKEDSKVQARVYDRLMIRHWDHWLDGKRNHVFVREVDGGEPVDLMEGLEADCPTVPFGGPEEFTWTPDGDGIVYTAKLDEHPERSTNYDLFRVPISGGQAENLTADNPAWDTQPSFSPDGKQLAYLAMERPGYESDRFQAMLLGPDGDRRSLTSGWDRSVGSLSWGPSSRFLVIAAGDEGRRSIFRVNLAGGTPRRLARGGYFGGVQVLPDGSLVGRLDSLTAPAELWRASEDGSGATGLTHFNDARSTQVEWSEPEEFWFQGAGDDRVHGWLLRPAGFRAGEKYPLVYLIHGGPQGAWNDHFHYRWNPQAYAGAGFAVAMVNFHGSTGYGQGFTDSIRRDWGGKPYEDLMLGLDHLLKEHDWIDGNRLGAAGASYGGYMINWMAGHTDRFRCLVNHDGLFSTHSMYYSTEELWFPEWDLGGTPWESKEIYDRWDPAAFVENWKTPMLVIHGQLDYRVVDTEGISAFTALQRRGIESKLLYFPDEDHWVMKPRNMKLWHDTVLDWLGRYLR